MDRVIDRRAFLRAASTGVAGGLAGCHWPIGAQLADDTTPSGRSDGSPTGTEPPTDLPEAVGVHSIATGLQMPVAIAFSPTADRRYIATNPGRVLVHGPDGLVAEPLLDLRGRVASGYEMGLLGIALHPAFPADRRLFVRYSAPPRQGTPDGYSHTAVLASFEVAEGGTRVVPDSERTVLEIPQPQPAHNAGDLSFGPDRLLYVPTGDGGGFGDTGAGHAGDWYRANGGGNGQDTAGTLLGGILRIDVDAEPTEHPRTDGAAPAAPTGAGGYAIPEDNPLVGVEGHRDEYFAWGFRNPWRLSFDREGLFVGDVGQDLYEEVDLVEKGGNYGWNVKEGPYCFDRTAMKSPLDTCPQETPAGVRGGEPLRDPILGYRHGTHTEGGIGTAVIGGYLYRGSAHPGLAGRYVFASLRPNGKLFVGIPPRGEWAAGGWRLETVSLTDAAAGSLNQILAIGRDVAGELYVLGGGGVHRVVPAG